tara:strand:+ start:594 stop:1649 length:1056 start_codon:yes stop_codon:yes gene_type:complete
MKLLSKDFRKGFVKIQTTSLDDLWYLSQIVEPLDKISGKTTRKIKISSSSEKAQTSIKKVFLKIEVEKIDFHKFSSHLRVSGKITEGTEDIPHGSYHTFDIDDNTTFNLEKKQFLQYQIDKLNDASKEKSTKVLLLTMDREEATFALLTTSGYKILSEIKGDVAKKEFQTKGKDFYSELSKMLEEYTNQHKIENIIIASPAFWKEDLMKKVNKSNLPKITLASCNTTGRNALEEVLTRVEVQAILKEDRSTKESILVDKLLAEISKNNLATYGFKEVKQATEAGAVKTLLISDSLIAKHKQEGTFEELNSIMKLVDSSKGEIHIISNDHDKGKQLEGLGGIAAILRYKLEY